MTDKPDLPVVGGAAGALMTHMPGKAVNRAILGVFQSLGGETWLKTWVESSDDRKDQFVTKLLPKLIVKEVQIDDRRSVEDLLDELDGNVVEGTFTEVGAEALDADDDSEEYYD